MTENEDEDALLVSGLGKQGDSVVRGRAAGVGARWVARRLPKDVHEIEVRLASPADEVIMRVATLIESTGQVVAQTGLVDGRAMVRGIVGAGVMNLNPSVITVTVLSDSEQGSMVHIRGAAKEGLIKQHGGRKAAERLAELLK